MNLLTVLGDNSSDRWLWRLPWSYYIKYGKLLSQCLLSSDPLLKVSSFCSDLKDYYQSAGNALYIVSTQVLWLQTTSVSCPFESDGPWAPVAESPSFTAHAAGGEALSRGLPGLLSSYISVSHLYRARAWIQVMLSCCLLWWVYCFGGKKHLAVFYRSSWAGNHAKPILFTSLGSRYLQRQHSWGPCCRSSTWPDLADASPEPWHHSRQTGSWGTAVSPEPPVLQSHWQTYPGDINAGVPSPDALFPIQDQGGFGVPYLHALAQGVTAIL